jgi:LuxR family maltose regulon positive regulatory protein
VLYTYIKEFHDNYGGTMNPLQDPILLKTKISIPSLRESLVNRNRLLQEITNGLQGRITAICAPAGYGKTTLISQWVRESALRAAWVSLDEMDNDQVRFWRYIGYALSEAFPNDSIKRISSLVQALPGVSLHTFLDALINELCVISSPLVLILDDYQSITNPAIHDSLTYFIDYLPSTVHIIIASRVTLPIPTSKWLARKEHTVFHSLQLQFTLEEIQSFYDKSDGLLLTPQHIQKLFNRTEGWVTGLQLAAVSLRAHTNRDHFIEHFQGNNQMVSEYLFEEVFGKLTSEMKHFLLYTSIFKRMDALICDTVTQQTNSFEILEQLKAWNLFVYPIDDHGVWFRYHQLFAEFLRIMIKRSNPAGWLDANRRASLGFAARGMIDEAIDHAIAAEDFSLLESLLDQHIGSILKQGEFNKMLRWFESASLAKTYSLEMSLIYTFVLTVTGQLETAMQQLEPIEQQVMAIEDAPRRKYIQSGVYFIKANLLFFTGNYRGWEQFANGISEGMLADNGVFYTYNFNISEPLVKRTNIGLRGALSSEVEVIGKRFSHDLESHGWNNSLINLYVKQSMCEGYYEWNRLEDCRALVRQLGQVADIQLIPGLYVPHQIMQARLYMVDGQAHLAHKLMDDAIEAATKYNDIHWLMFLRAFKVQISLWEGSVTQAKKEIAFIQLSKKDIPTFNREFEYLTLVRLLSRQHKYSDALRLLEQLKPQAVRENLLSSIVEISILQSLVEFQRGHRSTSLRHLHEALVIGQANGYVRSFVDEGSVMPELLQMYINSISRDIAQDNEKALTAYAQQLIGTIAQVMEPLVVTPDTDMEEMITPNEITMLQFIRKGASNKQIAAELGLSEGTIRVYLSRIYAKLGVTTRNQAWIKAEQLKLLQ